MSSAKIKKKSATGAPASKMPRQAAMPCLILVVLALIAMSILLFVSLRSASI